MKKGLISNHQEVDRILDRLERGGLRITGQRKTMIVIFEEAEGMITPREVYERMRTKYAGLSFDTVYRNIRILVEMGEVEAFGFPDGVRYQMRCAHEDHHHHFICMQCERITPIDTCPFELGIEIPPSFKVVRHTFEVHGYCDDCVSIEGGDGNRNMEFRRNSTSRIDL
jgi:Fur family zinc uptake transcriptional regulator